MEGLELGPNLAERLRQRLAVIWADSTAAERADWLSATLGIVAGNKPRTLRFSATQDGVHGMIAGGTGSGKSEMLMSLIVSMALRYDPTVLNFVLVDYKGGGTFKPFETLPHCVDMITNLNSAGVRRMFVAIRAEMERRQQLNAATGAKDIVDYRRKGYHLTREPYPFLFIIIDEYAEMIADQAEFKEELDGITRLGRALGVSLILASQKPTGVSDQMRVNIKFRLCLRVEGVDTSREMLRRSDAAFLPDGQPGRGYLQVGAENLELIQVASVSYTHLDVYKRQLLAQYCTFHAPHDARLLVLAANSDPWEWVEDLPHAQPDDVGDSLCFLDRLEPSSLDAADDASGLAVYLEGLRRRLVQRK